MDKKLDFGNDLSAIADEVTADVGDIVQALSRQKKKPTSKVFDTSTPNTPRTISHEPLSTPAASTLGSDTDRQFVRRREQKARTKLNGDDDIPLENVTTRLRRDTNALLSEAALRQQLKKALPSTRQGIIETALQEWFRRHDYGKGKAATAESDEDTD